MQERRARQEGKLKIDYGGKKYDVVLLSQGTQTGERAVLSFTPITKSVRSLEELGMRDKQREQLEQLIGPEHFGLVVFAALPGDGLSTTWQSSLKGTDRFMRDFHTVETAGKHEPDVENVDVQKYDPAKGESLEKLLPNLIRKQPEVLCVPEIASSEALKILAQWIRDENKLSIISIRGKDAADALVRLTALGAPADVVAPALQGVVYTRLIRRLCETCRE